MTVRVQKEEGYASIRLENIDLVGTEGQFLSLVKEANILSHYLSWPKL